MTTFVHHQRGPAEFTLTVFCSGSEDTRHDEAEVDVLGYWSPTDALGFLPWLSQQGSLQTPFGELMAAESRSGGQVDLGGWSGTPRGMDHAMRWRFKCPECGDTVPGTGPKVEAILEVLRAHGVPRLSMAALSARL